MSPHKVWKLGISIEEMFTSFIVKPLCCTPSISLSLERHRIKPIIELNISESQQINKNCTWLTIPFSYNIT